MKEYSTVGKSLNRVDAIAKATGRAKFATDIEMPHMLCGRILRSPYPHAKILSVDTSEAEALPGVKAVITGKDIGYKRYGFVDTPRYPADQLPLAIDKVRYVGDEVAAVAAIDRRVADEAISLIKVEYEELPAVFDPEEAMQDEAPEIHAEIFPDRPCAWEEWGVGRKAKPYKAENNICAISRQGHGDVEKGFAESDYVREDEFYIPATSHVAMEPHAAVASWDPSFGKLDIWMGHMGYEIRRYWIARVLNIPLSRVRINKTYVGGAFGGKNDTFAHEILAAYLSKKTLKPVKIVLTREEVFTACRVSHRFKINVKTGVKKDGTILAQEVRALNDAGAYRGSSPVVLFLTHIFRPAIYNIPNVRHEATGVYTNKAIGFARRGHGSPQMVFAIESQFDKIAEDIGLDPIEFRLMNIRKVGDVLPNGDKLNSCGLTEGIEKAIELSGWKEKRNNGGSKSRGVGIGINAMLSGAQYYPFGAAAAIKLNPDGAFTLYVGAVEFGQGSDTSMSQIAAEEIGVNLDDIVLVSGDSELCPNDFNSWLSGGMFVTGKAVRNAAADIRRQIVEFAAQWLNVREDDIVVESRQVYDRNNPTKNAISLGLLMLNSIQSRNGDPILGKGFCKPVPEVEFYPSLSKGTGRFTDAYGFSISVAEVEVDKQTGKTKVLKMTCADDCGFPINPRIVEGQIESQAVSSLGDALFEQIITVNGRIVNSSLTDYKIPGMSDIPEIHTNDIITIDPNGPFGAKEIGECSRAAGIGAIANAVYDAVGVRIKSLPLTPEKILEALKQKDNG